MSSKCQVPCATDQRFSIFRFALCICIVALGTWHMAQAQGFPWEWSPRSPLQMPTQFVGLEVATGYMQHNGDATYMQDVITCCTFESGSGFPLRFTVIGEQWVAAKTSVHVGFGLTMSNSQFVSTGDTLPWRNTQRITEYVYNVGLSYLTLEAGVRQRLFSSFASVGFSLRGQVLAAASESLIHRVVSPDDFYFTENPRSKEKDITESLESSFASFVLEPALSLQYDFALGRGLYLAPTLSVSIPVTSISSNATWRYLNTGFGIRLMRGL